MDHSTLGRILLWIGLFTAFIGIVFMVAGKVPFLGKLPGDIVLKRDHMTFYVPITSSLLISLILTILFRFFGKQ